MGFAQNKVMTPPRRQYFAILSELYAKDNHMFV